MRGTPTREDYQALLDEAQTIITRLLNNPTDEDVTEAEKHLREAARVL